ncbi:MAG: penicillin-binding protein activator [Candidatus Zixiibacteriota bacterium]
MSWRVLRVLGATLAMSCLWAGSFAQSAASPAAGADRALDDGMRLMREGKFTLAVRALGELQGNNADSANRDFQTYLYGKALYHSGNFTDALAAFRRLEKEHGQSAYVPYAYFFMGNIQYASGSPDRAVGRYLQALGHTSDPKLQALALESVDRALVSNPRLRIDAGRIVEIPEPQRCLAARTLGTRLLSVRQNDEAAKLLALCPDMAKRPTANRSDFAVLGEEIAIGVAVPLSGELQNYGEDILNGAVVAAEMYRGQAGRSLTIVPFDTRGEPVAAGRLVGTLADADIDAVIGPLTSEETAVASASLSCRSLPLLVPAATESGLTLLSQTSFQLSPNIELEGIVMAEYAVRNLKADSAVIMTSSNSENLTMAGSFERRFKELGGKVVAVEYYRSRDKDFGGMIRDVKSILLGRSEDTALYINERGDTLEPDAAPARVDCLFLPGSADQLRLLLPQLNFYNLRGHYLGSDGWGDDAIYGLGSDITRNVVFPSPFLDAGQSEAFLRFSASYTARYGKKPARLACLGHDAVKLVAQATAKDVVTREQLVRQLSATSSFEGAAARLSFGAHRENIDLPLYQIESGQPRLLEPTRSTSPAPTAPR